MPHPEEIHNMKLQPPKKILVLAPHADDEVLGVGGTIARLVDEGCSVVVAILTGHGEDSHPLWPRQNWDIVRDEARLANGVLGVSELIFRELPAACLDVTPVWKINSCVNEVIQQIKPNHLYIPFLYDLHKDHAAISYAATVSTRPYLHLNDSVERVLAYETLSETHLAPSYLQPAFQPNVFVDIAKYVDKKITAINEYKSQLQQRPKPRSVSAIKALSAFRGAHISSDAAEAFILLAEYIR
jgi:LmbE family N-acetylglucosaminyl deacetylase